MAESRRKIGQGIGETSSARGASPILDSNPTFGTLRFVGFAPITSTKNTGGQTVIKDAPPAGTIQFAGLAPNDRIPGLARPSAGIIEFVGFAPRISGSAPMALDTYDNILTALAKQTHYDDLTACQDDLFRQAELRIYRRLRLRTMETDLSVMASVGGAPIPADYIELKYAHTIVNGKVMELERQPGEFIYRKYRNRNGEAQPRYIGRQGSTFIFGPSLDSDYLLQGCYYRRLQSLQSTSTNWFTENAADLLMASGKVEIYNFKEDFDAAALWEQRFDMLATRVQDEDTREKAKGSPRRSHSQMAWR